MLAASFISKLKPTSYTVSWALAVILDVSEIKRKIPNATAGNETMIF
jgi:hypothetical protein